MQIYSLLSFFLLSVSSPFLVFSDPLHNLQPDTVSNIPSIHRGDLPGRNFGHFVVRLAPRDLCKRQTPEEVCGLDYVICNVEYCCPDGTVCDLRTDGWYCPADSPRISLVSSSTLVVLPTPSEVTPSATREEDPPSFTSDSLDTNSPDPDVTGDSNSETSSPYDAEGYTNSSSDGSGGSGGLGIGAIIGIVCGIVVVAFVVGAMVIAYKRQRPIVPALEPATENPITPSMSMQQAPLHPVQPMLAPQQGLMTPQLQDYIPQQLPSSYPPLQGYSPPEHYPSQIPPNPNPQYPQPTPQYSLPVAPSIPVIQEGGEYHGPYNGVVEADSPSPPRQAPTPDPTFTHAAPPQPNDNTSIYEMPDTLHR